jgi:hypothetical protein
MTHHPPTQAPAGSDPAAIEIPVTISAAIETPTRANPVNAALRPGGERLSTLTDAASPPSVATAQAATIESATTPQCSGHATAGADWLGRHVQLHRWRLLRLRPVLGAQRRE